MDVLTHRIFKRGINELSMFCVVFSLFIYGLFSECCDGNAVFVKDYSTDLLFPLIMKWNNEALRSLYTSPTFGCVYLLFFQLME